jgi:hypothetical protein
LTTPFGRLRQNQTQPVARLAGPSLARAIREARAITDLTRGTHRPWEQVAADTGVAKSTVVSWAGGARKPPVGDWLPDLAAALATTPADLVAASAACTAPKCSRCPATMLCGTDRWHADGR